MEKHFLFSWMQRHQGAILLGALIVVVMLVSVGGTAGKKVVGVLMFLFLPGFLATLLLIPRSDRIQTQYTQGQRALDPIERITLGILLSIIITSTLIYVLYWIQPIPRWFIDPDNPLPLAILVTVLLGVMVWWKHGSKV